MNSISINDLRSEDGCGLSLFLGHGTRHNVRVSHPDGWSILIALGASDAEMHVAISEPSSYTGNSKAMKLTYTDPVNFEGLHPEGAE